MIYALENCQEDLDFFNQRVEKGLIAKLEDLAKAEFRTVSYTEAVELLQKSGGQKFEFPVEWGAMICNRSMSVF